MNKELIKKYNVPGPRYTSYPTVPYWDNDNFTVEHWKSKVKNRFLQTDGSISLYIHLPFCESLCTYCGCNTRITVNHAVEEPYIENVLREWKLYLDLLPEKPKIKELHLGGGTPTFFSADNLEKLIKGILTDTIPPEHPDFSFEGHPANTTTEHLKTLFELGFKRVSFGIQDFDEKVQHAIHRHQTYEQVKFVTEQARTIGYESVNYDLIYGLPFQTAQTIRDTIEKVCKLMPDRIAFYSYAHVPWVKKAQRGFTEMDLPDGEQKRELYELGRQMLESAGYLDIGMDHFSLKTDVLYKATETGDLHRNFMGYTTTATKLLIGLGVSSISDTWDSFAQNVKVVEAYSKLVQLGQFPLLKGHSLDHEDLILRRHILNIMCRYQTSWSRSEEFILADCFDRLQALRDDELILLKPFQIIVTERGKQFLRNICMAFDARLWKNQPATQIFSTTA